MKVDLGLSLTLIRASRYSLPSAKWLDGTMRADALGFADLPAGATLALVW
jgi:hypothetical protein